VRGQYQLNIWMMRAKTRPERWKIFTALFLLPQRLPKKRKMIQRKWIATKKSARVL
jgi:hypothetical protein